MARKRKKSKAKKARRKQRKAEAAARLDSEAGDSEAADSDASGDDTASEAADSGNDTAPATDAGDSGTGAEPDDDVIVVPIDDDEPLPRPVAEEDEPITISIDDEEDDDREALIAEALAFVEAEEGEEAPGTADEAGDAVTEAEAEANTVGDAASDASAVRDVDPPHAGEADPDAPETPTNADDPDAPDRPQMTADAVQALTQMQAEGLIALPEELVLDLGEATTDEDRDRLLAAALAHVEMQEARYRVPTERGTRNRWKATAASGLVTLALLVSVAPPGILVPDPPTQLEEADRSYGVLVALLVQAQQIDAFRAREQRLPDDLSEVGTPLSGIRFVKSNSRVYQLVAHTTDGIAVVYDSAAPADIFRRIAEGWVTTREDG